MKIYLIMKITAVFLWLIGCAFTAFSQGSTVNSTDVSAFAGTWAVITDKSKLRLRNIDDFKNHKIEISIKGLGFLVNEFSLIKGRAINREYTLFLDGQGETNQEIKSKTKLINGKVIRK